MKNVKPYEIACATHVQNANKNTNNRKNKNVQTYYTFPNFIFIFSKKELKIPMCLYLQPANVYIFHHSRTTRTMRIVQKN